MSKERDEENQPRYGSQEDMREADAGLMRKSDSDKSKPEVAIEGRSEEELHRTEATYLREQERILADLRRQEMETLHSAVAEARRADAEALSNISREINRIWVSISEGALARQKEELDRILSELHVLRERVDFQAREIRDYTKYVEAGASTREMSERAAKDESRFLLENIKTRLEYIEKNPPTPATPWYVNLIQGITIVSILGFAFWLGQMSGKITETSTKLDKLYALTLESRDGLAPRLSAIEAKLDAIDKKIDAMGKAPGPARQEETSY